MDSSLSDYIRNENYFFWAEKKKKNPAKYFSVSASCSRIKLMIY